MQPCCSSSPMADLLDPTADTEQCVTRCLSLTQPWATLVAIGAKKYETRSWGTSFRGWLAIQASKGFPNDCRELCFEEPYKEVLVREGGIKILRDLPLGQVIAICKVTECILTNRWTPPEDSNEYAFGNYGPDRVAWKLEDVRRIKPFDAKGSLSIWKLPRPITPADWL